MIEQLLAKVLPCDVATLLLLVGYPPLWFAWSKERRGRIADLRMIAHLARGGGDDA